MLKWLLALTVCLAAPAATQEADAPFLRGKWFVRNCTSSTWEMGCRAYVLGYFHGAQTRKKSLCLPDGVDTGQLYDVAMGYMRAHPEKGHVVGMALLDEAWEGAFPCR